MPDNLSQSPRPRLPRLRRTPRTFVPDRALEAAQSFVQTESAGGIVLLIAAIAALLWANSPFDDAYTDLWHTKLRLDIGLTRVDEDLLHFVNDGLMALFFFVVGLEIKRELVRGELSARRQALLPIVAALGGMAVPALIYVAFNTGGAGSRGWAIPMATDIAFAVGALSILGGRVPPGAKVLLLAIAIVDDIGAILVIALFYTADVAAGSLLLAAGAFALMVVLIAAGVRNLVLYILLAAVVWLATYHSGVHATIAGVALGMLVPSRPDYDPVRFPAALDALSNHFRAARSRGDLEDENELLAQIEDLARGSEAPLERLERALLPWVSFGIMPLFALANAGIALDGDLISGAASSSITHGVVLGLVAGKPAGIVLASLVAVRAGICALPNGTTWRHVVGLGVLGGIGFTVSLFITGLAFPDNGQADKAKAAILLASCLAAAAGYLYLRLFAGSPRRAQA